MNWINKTHAALIEFLHWNKAFNWAVWFTVWAAWSVFAWLGMTGHSFIFGTLATLVSGYIVLWLCAHRWESLTSRIDTVDHAVWTVSVNGVCAGELSDRDYARILRSVGFDLRTYIAQVMRFVMHIWRAISNFVIIGPVAFFWAAVAFWVSSPIEFANAINSLKVVTSQDLSVAMPSIVLLVGTLALIYALVAHILHGGFRLESFDDAIAAQVLQAIACPATGKVTLSQFRQGGACDKFEFVN